MNHFRSTSQTIANEPSYWVTLHQGQQPSELLLITFGGTDTKLTGQGFGTDFALKNGYDTIYVAQKPGSQYQHLSAQAFCEAVDPLIHNYRRVVTYGASLGGYAALYYGSSINTKVIAASPKNSAHPFLRGKRTRFEDLEFVHENLLPN